MSDAPSEDPASESASRASAEATAQSSIQAKNAGWIGMLLILLGAGAFIASALGSGAISVSSLGFAAISGITILSFSLYGLVVLTRAIGLSDATQALGLPNGSVRALLALVLAIVFVAVASWTLGGLIDPVGPLAWQGDVAKDAADAAIKPYLNDQYIVMRAEKGERESVRVFVRRAAPTQDVMDIAKQLVTISATVLVTIVGFYFGSKSASDAVRTAGDNLAAVQRAASGAPADIGAGADTPPPDPAASANAIGAMAISVQAQLAAFGPTPLTVLHKAADGRAELADALAAAVQAYATLESKRQSCAAWADQAKTLASAAAPEQVRALAEAAVQANHEFAQALTGFKAARNAILKGAAQG